MLIDLGFLRRKGFPVQASALALSAYLAISVTGFSPIVVLLPLILSGLLLLLDDSEAPISSVDGKYRTLELATALLLASVLLSTIFSYSPADSAEAGVVLFPGLLMAYILNQIGRCRIHIILWGLIAMVFTASLVCLAMFIEFPSMEAGLVFQVAKTPALVVPNDMVLGVIFSPLILYSIMTEKRAVLRVLASIALIALIAALYYVKSRTCLLTAFLVFGIYLRYYFPRYFMWRVVSVVVAVAIVDRLFSLNIARDFGLISEESTRLAIWYASLDSVSQHPIVGFGPSQFYIAYEQVISSPSLPEWLVLDPRGVPWAHNMYLEALAERGIFGLVIFLFLLAQLHICLFENLRRTNSTMHSLNFAIYTAFVAFLFAGVFELTLHRIWVANALFVFIGFALWGTESETRRSR